MIEIGKYYRVERENEIQYIKVTHSEEALKVPFFHCHCLSKVSEDDFEIYSDYEYNEKNVTKIEEISYEDYKEIMMTYMSKIL